MLHTTNERQQRGELIAKARRNLKRINKLTYRVRSQTNGGYYHVRTTSIGWCCECADYKFRGVKCKHIFAVEISYAIRETVQQEQELIIQPISQLACRYCNSERIVKKAIRRNKRYNIQRYLCKDCGKRFSFNIGFEKMRAPADAITSAMQLYFSGESFRNVMRFLELRGIAAASVLLSTQNASFVPLGDVDEEETVEGAMPQQQ
jgi:transposase-like protein